MTSDLPELKSFVTTWTSRNVPCLSGKILWYQWWIRPKTKTLNHFPKKIIRIMSNDQGRIFEFTRVDSELTRVDSIPFAINNVNKFNLSRFPSRSSYWLSGANRSQYRSNPTLNWKEFDGNLSLGRPKHRKMALKPSKTGSCFGIFIQNHCKLGPFLELFFEPGSSFNPNHQRLRKFEPCLNRNHW